MNIKDIVKTIRNSKTIVNGSLFTVFSFLNKGISFVLLIILANYILPDDYGKLSLFSTAITLLGYFIAYCTENYLFISYFKYPIEEFKKDFTGIFVIASFNLILFGTILFITKGFLFDYWGLTSREIFIGLVICYTTIFLNMLLDFMRIQEKVVKYGYVSVGFASVNFVLSILFVAGLGIGWFGRIYAQVICSSIAFFCAIIFFYKNDFFHFSFEKERFRRVLFWGIPMIPHLGTTWIRSGCDRFIINQFHGLNDVGLFSFALNLAHIIIMIGGAFLNSYSVTIYKMLSDKSVLNKRQRLESMIRRINFLYTIISLIIVFGGGLLIPIILPNYSGAIPFFIILSLFAYVECLYFSISSVLPFFNRNKDVMYVTFTTSILHLTLSFILTRYSLYYTCFIYVVVQLCIYFMIKRKVNVVLLKNNII